MALLCFPKNDKAAELSAYSCSATTITWHHGFIAIGTFGSIIKEFFTMAVSDDIFWIISAVLYLFGYKTRVSPL